MPFRSKRVSERMPRTRIQTLLVVFVLLFGVVGWSDAAVYGVKKTAAAKTAKKTSASSKSKKPKVTLGTVRKTQLQRDKIRAQKAKSAATVNALKSSKKQVAESLAALNSNVRLTSLALDKAQRSAKRARADLAGAKARLIELEGRLAILRRGRVTAALDAYSDPGGGAVDALVNAADASESERREALAAIARRSQADLVDELNALEEDLEIERALAERSRKRAEEIEEVVTGKLSDYEAARKKQREYADTVESRLERELEESASLSGLDLKLSKELIAQNDLLTRQLASAGAGGRGSGKFNTASGALGNPSTAAGGDTHGIRVASSIRSRLASMLAAAQRDGVYLTGGGYRSSASQIALRRAHCGSSNYAIYQQRSSTCRPPTARPGNSMHERGLAIDFVDKGGALRRSSAGYRWLKAHAAAYGFFNLPSEPWHWSVNGR